jgi:hypothetical protein
MPMVGSIFSPSSRICKNAAYSRSKQLIHAHSLHFIAHSVHLSAPLLLVSARLLLVFARQGSEQK